MNDLVGAIKPSLGLPDTCARLMIHHLVFHLGHASSFTIRNECHGHGAVRIVRERLDFVERLERTEAARSAGPQWGDRNIDDRK
jgi:hypothetical protein